MFLETESYLQSICLVVLGVNILSSLGTVTLNITRNKPWLVPAFATFGIGVLNLIQRFYEDDKTPSVKLTPLTTVAVVLGVLVLGKAISNSASFGIL